MKVNYRMPLVYENQKSSFLNRFFSSYFYFGQKQVVVLQASSSNRLQAVVMKQAALKKDAPSRFASMLATTLKISSYFTMVAPLIGLLFVAKRYFTYKKIDFLSDSAEKTAKVQLKNARSPLDANAKKLIQDHCAYLAKLNENVDSQDFNRLLARALHLMESESYAVNLPLLQALLNAGADPKAQVSLHHWNDIQVPVICLASSKEIVDLLVEYGADVNQLDESEQTALYWVKSKEAAQALLQHGANVNARNSWGRTPLHHVSNKEVAACLLDHGADSMALDSYKQPPLFRAHNKEIAQVLVERGANLFYRDSKGDTLLHCNRYLEVLQWAFQQGMNLNQPNRHGQTPLACCHRRYADIIDWMVKNGAR